MIRKNRQILVISAALFAVMLTAFAQPSSAQIVDREIWRQDFISRDYRPRWGDAYENFGNYDLRRMPEARDRDSDNPMDRGPVTPVTYDQFGNFLLPGGEIYSMSWNQSRVGTNRESDHSWFGGTRTSGDNFTQRSGIFNRLVIASDEFSNWQTKFIVARNYTGYRRYVSGDPDLNSQYTAGGVRTYFTPSTLKMSNFDGFRWDASSRKNNVSIVASPGDNEYDDGLTSSTVNYPMYGIHWQSVLGDIMKLGATFVSKQRGTISGSHQDIDQNIRDEPSYVYLVITDDSPVGTGPGAMLHGVRAQVNGEWFPVSFDAATSSPVKGRVTKIDDINQMFINDRGDFTDQYLYQTDYWAMYKSEETFRNSRGSWFLESLEGNSNYLEQLFSKTSSGTHGYVNLLDDSVSWDPNDPNDKLRLFEQDITSGGIEAQGTDVVIVEMLVPNGTKELAFNVNVANDYCIDIISAMYSRRQIGEADWYDAPLDSNLWDGKWNVIYDKKHCRKAEGNVQDGSNQQWVKVYYDRITGMNVYGMDMEFNWRGLFLRGEYNEYNTYWSYPVAQQIEKGVEHKRTTRAWFVNAEKDFGSWSLGGEIFDYPLEYMQYMPTIEDNDDNDLYPGMLSGSKESEYPGLDADFDRYIDTNWKGDPYLDYFYDSITIGDDFNHNGVVDRREDDSQIDLPYERDSQGQHYFLKIKPRNNTLITLGHYDVRQEYFEGRNFTRYLKIRHYQQLPGIGEFTFYSRTERIDDNYKLWYYRGDVYESVGNYWTTETNEDHHEAINNWNFLGMVTSRITAIPNTNIINNFRFETAYDVGSRIRNAGTFDDRVLNRLQLYNDTTLIDRYGDYNYSMEHKVDYTLRVADFKLLPPVDLFGYRLWGEKRIRELKIMPMVKMVHSHQYHQKSNYYLHSFDRHQYTYDFYPILRLDYRVAPKTVLRFGMQGMSGLEQQHRSKAFPLEDYDQKRFILAFENQSLYQGFNLVVLAGVESYDKEYVNDKLKVDAGDRGGQVEYFITLRSEARQ